MKSISRVEVIRELSRQGKIYKEICKTTQSDCRTLKNHNECDDINESPKGATQRPTKLDPYKEEIQELIDEGLQNRHKQRSTAQRVKTLLEERHPEFNVSYPGIQRFVRMYKRQLQLDSQIGL